MPVLCGTFEDAIGPYSIASVKVWNGFSLQVFLFPLAVCIVLQNKHCYNRTSEWKDLEMHMLLCNIALCFIELRCIALTRIPWSRDDKHISTHRHSTCHSLSRSVGLESHNSYILSSCSINWQWRCQTQMLCVGNASFIRSSENVLLHGIPEKWMWKVTTRMRSAAWSFFCCLVMKVPLLSAKHPEQTTDHLMRMQKWLEEESIPRFSHHHCCILPPFPSWVGTNIYFAKHAKHTRIGFYFNLPIDIQKTITI